MKKAVFIVFVLCIVPAYAGSVTKADITFTLKNAAPVVFSHDYHIKTRGVKCAACHFHTFAASSEGFQMKREKMTKRDFCEHCHNGLKAFDSRSEKNCIRCHSK